MCFLFSPAFQRLSLLSLLILPLLFLVLLLSLYPVHLRYVRFQSILQMPPASIRLFLLTSDNVLLCLSLFQKMLLRLLYMHRRSMFLLRSSVFLTPVRPFLHRNKNQLLRNLYTLQPLLCSLWS